MKFEIDPNMLADVMAYKSMYVLATTKEVKGHPELKATHICCCLAAGRNPMWAVWNVHGKFQRFFSSKAEIQENYDQLVWRPMMASWKFRDIAERDVEKRKAVLEATMTESPAKRRAALRAV